MEKCHYFIKLRYSFLQSVLSLHLHFETTAPLSIIVSLLFLEFDTVRNDIDFCLRFYLLNIILLRVTHVVACINSFFYCWIVFKLHICNI